MFKYFLDDRYSSTILLYLIIFIVSTVLGFMSQQRRKDGTYKFKKYPFFILFVFLWLFFALNDVGADTIQYRLLYENVDDNNYWFVVERGYWFLNFLLHQFIKDPLQGVAIIRTIQLFLVFVSFYILKDKISIGYAIMAYVSLAYFASFNLLRLSLALSGCMISFALMVKKHVLCSILLTAAMFFIHRSSMFFLLFILAYYVCYQNIYFKRISTLRLLFVITIMALPFVGSYFLASALKTSFFTERYDNYLAQGTAMGIMVYLVYIPLFAVVYFSKHVKQIKIVDSDWYNINSVFSICGFVFALMGYEIGILTRANVLFIMPFAFYLGFYESYLNNSYKEYVTYRVFFILYFTIRFLLNIDGLMVPSQLNNFKLII